MNGILLTIPWLEESFGRIYSVANPVSRAIKRSPASYPTMWEYRLFLESDDIPAYVGYAFRREKITDSQPHHSNWQREREISIILGCRMDLIYPGEIESPAESIREEFELALSRIDGLEIKQLVDHDMEAIFEGYDIREATLESTVFPTVFFRWNGTLTYRNCL